MWIKICGLTEETGLRAALEAGADAVGFVFFPPSPRSIAFEHAAELAAMARGKAETVALTVNADDALLEELVETVQPDILQLHGTEPPVRVQAIKRQFGVPAMKALPVAEREDLAAVAGYRSVADRILLDAKPPKNATRPGGNGEAFEWALLSHLDPALAYVLSGGLDADNVAEALSIAGRAGRLPCGVDVSSGVENAPGIKNPDKVARFVDKVRSVTAVGSESSAATQPA